MATSEKKRIVNDWLQAFPELGKFSNNKFYKVIGPLIVGLELIDVRGFGFYRPHFTMYLLWKESASESLKVPIVLFEFETKKNLQFSIPYEEHDLFFKESVAAVKSQLIIPFLGDCSLDQVINVINYYLGTHRGKAPGDGNKANLIAAQLYMSSYLGNKAKTDELLETLDRESRKWNPVHIRPWFGKIDVWVADLKNKIADRDNIAKQVDNNLADIKIRKLPSSVLV